MTRKIHKIVLGLVVALAMSTGLISGALAQSQPNTTEHINQIRVSCVSAKNIIAQLQTSDALLRVNRGQLYEYMTTKLMSRFNTRVENNRLNAKSLIAVTGFYNQVLEKFRTDYQAYAEQLSATLKIDCTTDPVGFYNAVIEARLRRSQVHSDIIQLNQNLGEYRSAFDAFLINFNRDRSN